MLRFATGLPSPMNNSIARAQLEADEVERAVEEAAAWYRQQPARFFWWTGPQSSPPDLDARLEAAGLSPAGRDWLGMAMPLAEVDEELASPDGVVVEKAVAEADVALWAEVFCDAHEVPAWAGESWVEAARRAEFGELPWRCWVACLDGEPAGVGLSFVGAGAVGLYGIGTLPQARRRGVGTALTLVPMLQARDEGVDTAILHATPDGEKLYPRLGFTEYCRVSRFLGGT
jgi:GNAT superfamily N-acetyltransferase